MGTKYQYRVLLCDQRDSVYQAIISRLPDQADVLFDIQRATSTQETRSLLEAPQWDVALVGWIESGPSEPSILSLFAQHAPEVPIICLLDQSDPEKESQAEQSGASDCLAIPEITGPLLTRVIRYTIDRRSWERGRTKEPPIVNDDPQLDLLSKMQEAIIALDEDFKLTAWNRAAEELYGWNAREVLGRELFDVIRFEAPRTEIAKALSSFVRSGTYQVEAAQYRKDGSKITVISSVVALFGAKGKIEGYILQNRDVSDQKRVHEEREQILTNLKNARIRAEYMAIEARQRAVEMETIFESLVDGVLIFGVDDQPIRANRAAVQILGFDPCGRDWTSLSNNIKLHDRQGNLIAADEHPFYLVHQGETIRGAHYSLKNTAGETFSLIIDSSPLYNNGQISGAVLVLHDNTEQEQLIRNLEAERSRLSTIFANMYEAIVLTDSKGNILLSNPTAKQKFFQALVNPDGEEYELLQSSGLPYFKEDYPLNRSILFGESHINLEIGVRQEEGEIRHFLASTAPILDRKGNITGALGVFQDITERKKTEEELRRQMSATEIQHYLTQYRDREHLNIAHDLHDGPLQEIIGLSFTLSGLTQQMEDEDQRAQLSSAYDLAQKVIKDIRAYCNDLRPPTLGRFGLDKTIKSYTEKLKPQYPRIKFKLDLESHNRLSNEVRIALFRIYKELIQNVVRHSNATQVEVRLFTKYSLTQMEVYDNGTGFDMPVDWVDLARNGHLGLVGVRERAESIGGQAEVISSPLGGTKVVVRIPLHEESQVVV